MGYLDFEEEDRAVDVNELKSLDPKSGENSDGSSPTQVKEANEAGRWQLYLKGFTIVLFNFTTSILLVNSVKCLYDWCGFKFPLFIAALHMAFSWITTAVSLHLRGDCHFMSIRERVEKVLPFTLFHAASLACANFALTYMYPSYHEMIQCLTPLFTLGTSMILDGKRYNSWAYWAMIPVCGGGAICSFNEVNFSVVGCSFSLGSVFFRSLKTILQGRLLCDQNVDSITLCFYMAPFNLTILAMSSILTEGTKPLRALLGTDSSFAEQFYLWMWLLVSGVLACSFNILSYMTIKHLSPVGTNVIGNAKTPAIILLSTLFFGNPVKDLQWLGLLVTFFGIILHSQKGRTLEVKKTLDAVEPRRIPGFVEIDAEACTCGNKRDRKSVV